MAEKDYANGAGPGGGLGTMHGQIGSPQDPCPYSISASDTTGETGGYSDGSFSGSTESSGQIMSTTLYNQKFSLNETGKVVTPMDTDNSIPGVRGGDGYGSVSGGGAKVASPFSSPWGDSISKK